MKQHNIFLKLIILEKLVLGFIAVILAFGVLSLVNKDMEVFAEKLVMFFDLDMDNAYIETVVTKLGMVTNGTIIGVSLGMISYATLNLLESYGLHRRRRWAEWLTVIATALFIPFEIYEIVQEVTSIRVGVLILNVAIVYYLAKHKELFNPGSGFLKRLLWH